MKLPSPKHHSWATIGSYFIRIILAGKFFSLAILLGPEEFGKLGMALATLAILELATDFGLGPALIQSKKGPTPEQRIAARSWMLLRAGLIGIAGLVVGEFFNIPQVYALLVGGIAIARALQGVEVFRCQRGLNYRAVFVIKASLATLDGVFAVSLGLVGGKSAAVLAATLAAELIVAGAIVLTLSKALTFSFHFQVIRYWISFGKWLWVSNCLTAIQNQADKLIAGSFAGASALGGYQTVQKAGQMAIADPAMTLSEWVLPRIARENRLNSRNTAEVIRSFQNIIVGLCGCGAVAGIVLGPFVVKNFMSPEWQVAIPIILPMCMSMFLGGWIASSVAALKATGQSSAIFRATLLQTFVFIPLVFIGATSFDISGIAWAYCLALAVTALSLACSLGMMTLSHIAVWSMLTVGGFYSLYSQLAVLLVPLAILWVITLAINLKRLVIYVR